GVAVVRRADRRPGGTRARGHVYDVLTPPLPGQRAEVSCHALAPGAATGGPDDPPIHEPGSREPAVVTAGRLRLVCDGRLHAFDGLRLAGRRVRRPDRTLATADHNVPTDGSTGAAQIADRLSRVQVETLERNCEEFGIPVYSLGSERQGIVHVIGPELGTTQPGMTIVCGDSHTATHGAFGALAVGIGTSEVEHVLATQTLIQPRPRSMRIVYRGELGY